MSVNQTRNTSCPNYTNNNNNSNNNNNKSRKNHLTQFNNRRPNTAPSTSSYNTTTTTTTTTSNETTNLINSSTIIPNSPPITSILSHYPTRSHLFRYLLNHSHQTSLNLLILLLDLLTLIRSHASQTNWSFDDPIVLLPVRHTDSSSSKQSTRIRPGTSDGLRSSTTSRFRLHTRSSLFRSILPPPQHEQTIPNESPLVIQEKSVTTVSSPNRPTTLQPNWFNHLRELYAPPLVDLQHGWFIPLPLPSGSNTLSSLSKQLSISNSIPNSPEPLKVVGQIGCQELSEIQIVRDWWFQHSTELWPGCSRQVKCQSFDDLLSLWPSLHFPTPSISQLYKASNHLSKSRTKLRLNQSSSQDALSSNRSLHCQTTLRSLFEVYLGQPSPLDLESIQNIILKPKSTSSNHHLQKSLSVIPSQRSSIFAPEPPLSPLIESNLDEDSDQPKLLHLRSQKLRQFFGHEVDSILPPTSQEKYSTHSRNSNKDQPLFSNYTISNMSVVSLGPTPTRRKSSASPIEFDRPRKRSSVATLDISLARLVTSTHVETPSTPQLSQQKSLPHLHTRLTVVGTSPSSPPTFFGSTQNYGFQDHQLIPTQRTHADDSNTAEFVDPRTPSPFIDQQLTENSNSHLENSAGDTDAAKLKRITKLEKILGEPMNFTPYSNLGYGVVGVQVVREVVEDTEIKDTRLSNVPSQHNKNTHSRAISYSHPTSFLDSSRQRLPNASTCSLHRCSPSPSFQLNRRSDSRPSTASSETIFDRHGPSCATRLGGKRRLGKLQKLWGDVTHHGHHQKHGRNTRIDHHDPLESKNLPMSKSILTKQDEPDHNRCQSRFTSRVQPSNQEDFMAQKQTSFLSLSSSSPASSLSGCAGSRWNSATLQNQFRATFSDEYNAYSPETLPQLHHSSSSRRLTCLDRGGAPSLSPKTNAGSHHSSFTQYSPRSARKLEKLLGEQIPRQPKYFGNTSDPMQWGSEVINYSLPHHPHHPHHHQGELEKEMGGAQDVTDDQDHEAIQDLELSRLHCLPPPKSIQV